MVSEGSQASSEVFAWHKVPSACPVHGPISPSKQNCFRDALNTSWSVLFCYSHSLDALVVGDPRDLNVRVTVRNDGEDSYSTKATIYYPSGLSYRKVSVYKVAKSFSVSRLCFSHIHGWQLTVLYLPALVPGPALPEALAGDHTRVQLFH